MNYQNVVRDGISFDTFVGYEYLIILPSILDVAKYKEIDDNEPPEPCPYVVLVYEFKGASSKDSFVYKFVGAKVK